MDFYLVAFLQTDRFDTSGKRNREVVTPFATRMLKVSSIVKQHTDSAFGLVVKVHCSSVGEEYPPRAAHLRFRSSAMRVFRRTATSMWSLCILQSTLSG